MGETRAVSNICSSSEPGGGTSEIATVYRALAETARNLTPVTKSALRKTLPAVSAPGRCLRFFKTNPTAPGVSTTPYAGAPQVSHPPAPSAGFWMRHSSRPSCPPLLLPKLQSVPCASIPTVCVSPHGDVFHDNPVKPARGDSYRRRRVGRRRGDRVYRDGGRAPEPPGSPRPPELPKRVVPPCPQLAVSRNKSGVASLRRYS